MGEDLRGREEERPVCGGQEAQEEPSFKTRCCGQMLQVIEDTWSQPSFRAMTPFAVRWPQPAVALSRISVPWPGSEVQKLRSGHGSERIES